MEELIPILVWGLLIFFFSAGGKKKRQAKARQARDARLQARSARMAQDAAARSAVGEEGEDPRAREHAWGTREPMAGTAAEETPAPPVRRPEARAEQVPQNVWELVEALARGTMPKVPVPLPEPADVPSLDRGTLAEPVDERRTERTLQAPATDTAPTAEGPRPTRRSIQERGRARSDGGITAVDAVEHAEGADPTLTEVDVDQHSRVATAVARARARRNAGKTRERRSIFGGRGKAGVRRAIVLSEVLGQPTATRDGLGPHEPPG